MAESHSNRNSMAGQFESIIDKIALVEGILVQSLELHIRSKSKTVSIPGEFVNSMTASLSASRKQLLSLDERVRGIPIAGNPIPQ
jgi:hypothetical protein